VDTAEGKQRGTEIDTFSHKQTHFSVNNDMQQHRIRGIMIWCSETVSRRE
jgi:hypothetical protein